MKTSRMRMFLLALALGLAASALHSATFAELTPTLQSSEAVEVERTPTIGTSSVHEPFGLPGCRPIFLK
jgi:hypothetical protein